VSIRWEKLGGEVRAGLASLGKSKWGSWVQIWFVIEFCVGSGVRFSNLGWEIDPCHHMIQCRLTPLALPRVLLLCVGVSSGTVEEVFKFVIRRS